MVVTLWRRCNRCGAAVLVQALRRGTAGILRYRLMCRHLLRDGALRLALRQRRHHGHRRTRGTACHRRLGLFVATAKADIGQALQQGHAALLRVLLLRLAAGLADLISFGVPFLANPDLPERFAEGAPLNTPNRDTFYMGGASGYIDYPTRNAVPAAV